ncbi:PREDICTED: uncharacterized protein LOC106106982 isoform X1 [Papilio polytes]|uniref:uncharacterized protein LOC106106982 isoform X1 n=2 Tax=Papilio polytes TaxID=76194 RepID=UPI00067643C5|nr:PREDICTED: uncharacterized protein LOC106106982 isoform X1 [Papilio polytes]
MIYLMKQKSIVTLCTVSVSINLLLRGCLANKIKKDFHDELTFLSNKASIEKARDSFVDSAAWDVESVLRLTSMLRASQKAETEVEQQQIMPGRRFMNYADSLKAFPSLSQDHENNIYYDMDATHNEQETWNSGLNADNSVIVITNPSEARLPADTISVKLLRETMEARAKAARSTPSTTKLS